jgi:hypothetical protein
MTTSKNISAYRIVLAVMLAVSGAAVAIGAAVYGLRLAAVVMVQGSPWVAVIGGPVVLVAVIGAVLAGSAAVSAAAEFLASLRRDRLI